MKKYLKVFLLLIIISVLLFSCEELIKPEVSVLYITSDGTAAPTVKIGETEFSNLANGVTSSPLTFEAGDYDVVINGINKGQVSLTQFGSFLVIVKGTGVATPSYSFELYSEE